MTANEKWKIAILGELKSRSISEWFEKHMTLPCVLLSSMEKKDVTEELMVCPYCFEKTKIEYPTLKKHTVSRTCEHCKKEFENGCVTTDESTKAYFKVGRCYYRDNIIMTRANICGEDGILYIEVESVDLKYNVAKKRVVIKPNIIGYGFAFVGGRYRYMYGKASRARTANYSSYIIISLVNLYFHFQLLTNLASIATKYQPEGYEQDAKLLRYRTLQTVMLTAILIITRLQPWLSEAWTYISVVMLIVYLIAGICLMKALFDLRRCLPTSEEII